MNFVLAYAVGGDQSLDNMKLILSVCVVLAAVAVTAFVPIVIARRRQARQAGAIMPAAVLWAVVTAALVVPYVVSVHNWALEDKQQIMSGYYDPRDQAQDHPPPVAPVPLWIALGVMYVGLMLWAGLSAPSRPSPDQHLTNGEAGE